MSKPLERFLSRNDIIPASDLPLAHTTRAYHMNKLLSARKIDPRACEVFGGEKLSYFFYGRPGYKFRPSEGESKCWELPSVILMNYDSIVPHRAFPFDTGAFETYPSFISMMDMLDYEVQPSMHVCQKIVGAFFVDSTRYFKMKPRSEDSFVDNYQLGPLDAEIRALHSLAIATDKNIDDRRLTIEIQTTEPVLLEASSVRAIIVPEEYTVDDGFMEVADSYKADVFGYDTFPLNQQHYYSAIYNIVYELLRKEALVR